MWCKDFFLMHVFGSQNNTQKHDITKITNLLKPVENRKHLSPDTRSYLSNSFCFTS